MVAYLSTEKMLLSLWGKGQQQWRDGHCSSLADSSHRIFVITARIVHMSVHHP
jgi:hypothetical protein